MFTGKSQNMAKQIAEAMLRARGQNIRDQPLIEQYMAAIIDPHGEQAGALFATLSQSEEGRLIVEDINSLRRTLRLNPIKPLESGD